MNTIKGILDKIQTDFIDRHSIINTLITDDISKYDDYKDINYPMIYLSQSGKGIGNLGGTTYTFEFVLCDIKDDVRSYVETLNDVDLLVNEFFTYFGDDNETFWFTISPLNDFVVYSDTRDNTFGVYTTIKITAPGSYCENNIRFKDAD